MRHISTLLRSGGSSTSALFPERRVSLPYFGRFKYRSILPRHEESPILRKAFRSNPLLAFELIPALVLFPLGGLHAQNLDEGVSSNSVTASIGAFLRGARIRGGIEAMLGGEASLHLPWHLSVGVVGGGLLEAVRLVESGPGLGTDLRMGYGGLLFGYEARTDHRVSVTGRLLLGAGNAEVRAAPVGNELGVDNFLVFEPEVVLRARAAGPVQLGLAAGYRMVLGVQDLPNLVADDLEGVSLTITLLIS